MNGKYNVIFLDCDGVLNRACHGDTRYFTPECFQAFQRIVCETDARIVLSTSWREFPDWENMLRDFLGAIGITVVGKTDVLRTRNEHDRDIRPSEIRTYLNEHGDDIANYVVLDDIDMRDDFPGHCVCTCAYQRIGLDEAWAEEAIAILNKNATDRNVVLENGMIITIVGCRDGNGDDIVPQLVHNGKLENLDGAMYKAFTDELGKANPDTIEKKAIEVCDRYNSGMGKRKLFRSFRCPEAISILKGNG